MCFSMPLNMTVGFDAVRQLMRSEWISATMPGHLIRANPLLSDWAWPELLCEHRLWQGRTLITAKSQRKVWVERLPHISDPIGYYIVNSLTGSWESTTYSHPGYSLAARFRCTFVHLCLRCLSITINQDGQDAATFFSQINYIHNTSLIIQLVSFFYSHHISHTISWWFVLIGDRYLTVKWTHLFFEITQMRTSVVVMAISCHFLHHHQQKTSYLCDDSLLNSTKWPLVANVRIAFSSDGCQTGRQK